MVYLYDIVLSIHMLYFFEYIIPKSLPCKAVLSSTSSFLFLLVPILLSCHQHSKEI